MYRMNQIYIICFLINKLFCQISTDVYAILHVLLQIITAQILKQHNEKFNTYICIIRKHVALATMMLKCKFVIRPNFVGLLYALTPKKKNIYYIHFSQKKGLSSQLP